LIRLPRIAKFYKMLKLFRMVKILKLVKNKDKIKSQMGKSFKSLEINAGTERLTSFMFGIIFAEHIFACFWLILGTEEASTYRDTWMSPSIKLKSSLEQYILSFYFVTTTMTTVGYGDMSIATIPEKIYMIMMMMIGVFLFSMV